MLSEALTVVEITGLFLSLIFVAVQILLQKSATEQLSAEALKTLSQALPFATFSLYFAALLAIVHSVSIIDAFLFKLALAFINGALATIAYAVARAAIDFEVDSS